MLTHRDNTEETILEKAARSGNKEAFTAVLGALEEHLEGREVWNVFHKLMSS